MSQSRFHRLGIVLETTAGSTPGTPTVLLLEGGPTSPVINAPKQTSDTIRNDARVKSSVKLNRSASFARSQELVYPTVSKGLWTEIRAGLRTTEAAQVTCGNTSTTDAGVTTITRTGGGSYITDGIQPGDVVLLAGSGTASENGYWRVTAVAASLLTVNLLGATFVGGSDVVVTRGARMVDGTTGYSYSVEECWLESPYNMVAWTGQRVGSLSFGFAMGSKSNISIGYVGMDGTPGTMDDGAADPPEGFAGATYTAYTESPVFSPADAITAVVNNEALPLSAFTISTDIGARVRHSTAGGAVPDVIPTGTFRCSISATAYASVLSLLTQYRAGTEVPVYVVMEDPDGKAISVSLGTVVWDIASLPTPGIDQDAMVTATGTATLTTAVDANDQDWTLRFQRFE